MPIIRRHPRRFTIVPNEAIEVDLSFEALGVLTYLLSKPDDWTINTSEIRKRGGIGKDKMQRIMRELREVGLLHLETARDDETGKVQGQVYVLYDAPHDPKNREPENPAAGKSGTILNTDSQPMTDYLQLETPYSPPSRKSSRSKKTTPRQVLEHVLSKEDTDAVIEHRQRLRKPLTHRAAKILANAFSEIPPEKRSEAVDMMIVSGWTGFKAEWFNNRQQQSTSGSLPSEMLAEKIMEMSNGSNTHTLLALAKWGMARRGYALSKDWKSVLVEIDTIAKGLATGGEYVDEIMALAIEDLTNGDEGAKLNADMIRRRYNDMLKAVRGSTKFVYDEDGSGHFETILSREGEELRRRISERFGNIPLLEDKR